MSWVIGFDEAGRGSLVGELIVAGLAVHDYDVERLRELGVRDSKQLSPSARQRLYKEIIRMGPFVTCPIRPSEIDHSNINYLEESAIAKIIEIMTKYIGLPPRHIKAIYIDKFGELKFLPKVLERLGFSGKLVDEPKADVNYPVVSAASIIAKVVRDARIAVLRSMYGVEGSGYPSDPRTVDWVMKTLRAGRRPPIIRYSWGTLRGTSAFVRKAKSPGRTLEDFMV